MNSGFSPIYVAAMITKGSKAYLKKGDKFFYLPGEKVKEDCSFDPVSVLKGHLLKQSNISFMYDWLQFIGATIHEEECCPNKHQTRKKLFNVWHFWIKLDVFSENILCSEDWYIFDLKEIAENKENLFLYADQLAAKKILTLI